MALFVGVAEGGALNFLPFPPHASATAIAMSELSAIFMFLPVSGLPASSVRRAASACSIAARKPCM